MAVDVRPEARPAPVGAFDDLIRAVADRAMHPAPWVDAASYPWAEEDFSSRFVRRANYQTLYGMKDTGDEVEDLIGLLALPSKARVLDLCSGNGRHAIAMALRGYRMTGIDLGPGAVVLARDTARNLGLSIDFRQLDVLHISFEEAFDGAYLACAGLSDFSPSDARVILELTERALVPGGRVAAEYGDVAAARPPEMRAWQYVSAESSLFLDKSHLQLDERFFDPATSAEIERSYVLPAEGRTREFTRCRQYYTESGMRDLLESARFEVVSFGAGSAPGLRKVVGKKR